MESSDWVSVGALAVAVVSIVVSGFIAPRVGARIEREHRIGVARSEVYVDTIRLLRARVRDIDGAALGHPPLADDPDLGVESTMARLALYADKAVWEGVSEFFTLYWRRRPFARRRSRLADRAATTSRPGSRSATWATG